MIAPFIHSFVDRWAGHKRSFLVTLPTNMEIVTNMADGFLLILHVLRHICNKFVLRFYLFCSVEAWGA